MGYYASWYGTVQTNDIITEDTIKELKYAFEDVYYDEKKNYVELSGYEKYYEDNVYDILEKIKPTVVSGRIEFAGEDDNHWIIYFKDGNWVEESGKIYYESDLPAARQDKEEFIGQIIDVIQDNLEKYNRDKVIKGKEYDDIREKLINIMKAWKVF